ncbi:WEB family protein At5g55860-like [Amaranthus tricolor]|uniref:WEB family protein At5g55860-like n=1 Tax=Amaranthus tricolor TaxID=29722 RepID=UPI00258A1C0F|nr:WEB family protein At5g55860-like [Amaranthus tricolor]
MVNIARTHTRRNSIGGSLSPKASELGEVDTKAPFQSVKDALSLFGVPSSSPPHVKTVFNKKSKPQPQPQPQEVSDDETQFHLALSELKKLKEQLIGAELKKRQAIPELQEAQRTLIDLQEKLKDVNASKKNILETAEALKERARKLEEDIALNDVYTQDIETIGEDYRAAILELDAVKQQLSNVHTEYEAALEAKTTSLRLFQEADAAADAHRLKVRNLNEQIATMQEALAKLKSCKTAEEEHQKVMNQKDKEISSRRLAKQELEREVLALQDEHRFLLADDQQAKLVETNAGILCLEEKVSKARVVHLEAQKAVKNELEVAKKSLERIAEENLCLQMSLESLKLEQEQVGKELSEQKVKIEESEALVNELKVELENEKKALELGLTSKTIAADGYDDMHVSIERLTMETEKAKKETEEMKKRIEEEEQQTCIIKEMIVDMRDKLASVLKRTEEARAAEKGAQEEIKAVKAEEPSVEISNGMMKVSAEEYNSLMKKINESENLAYIEITGKMRQIKTLLASQTEAKQKFEEVSKEIKELEMKEDEALKAAEMAEAAKIGLEAELHRRYRD